MNSQYVEKEHSNVKSSLRRLDSFSLEGSKTKSKLNKKEEKNKSLGSSLFFKKLIRHGEVFLNSLPLKKILPIMKRSKNKNFLWIIFFVAKFIKNLKEITFFKKFKKLTKDHFAIISDNSWPNHYQKNIHYSDLNENFLQKNKDRKSFRNKIGRFKRKIITQSRLMIEKIYFLRDWIDKKIPIFEPDRPFRFAFDTIMFLYLVMLISVVALNQGFDLKEHNYYYFLWVIFQIFPFWIFLFQIILDLNTSYYSKGVYITNRTKIFKHYLKYDFILDLFTIVPLFIHYISSMKYLETFMIIRMINLDKMIRRLEEYMQLQGKKEGVFQLIKMIINLLFLAHLCACVWHYIGLWEISIGVYDNWLYAKKIENEHWFIRYIYSLYFSIVTMMTVGYGDISSNNYIESCFNVFIIIYGCGVFAYSINNIGNIFKEMYYEDKEFKKKIKIITDYMNKRGINKFLQMKIKKYLEYMYEESKMNYQDSLLMSQSLSQTLREECYHELYGRLLKNHHLFSKFSSNFMDRLSNFFHEASYAPDDIIQNLEENDNIIHFILKGEVNILLTKNKNNEKLSENLELTRKKKGETIDELFFLTGQLELILAKCDSVTHVAFLKRKDFIKVLKEFPEDYEKFCCFRDNAYLYNNNNDINQHCLSCKEKDHIMQDCPLIHYIPKKINIIKRYQTSEDQQRENNNRCRKSIRFKAVKNLFLIQNSALNFVKAMKLNEDSQTIQDSDDNELSDNSQTNSAMLDPFNENKIIKRRGSIDLNQNNFNFGKNSNENNSKQNSFDELNKIEEESKDFQSESSQENYKERLGKFTQLKIDTKTKIYDFPVEIAEENAEINPEINELTKKTSHLQVIDKKSLLVSPLLTTTKFHRKKSMLKSPSFKEDQKIRTNTNTPSLRNLEGSEFSHFEEKHKKLDSFTETLENFDKIQNFKFYFIADNFENVIKKYKRKKSPLKKHSRKVSNPFQRQTSRKNDKENEGFLNLIERKN